MCLRRLSNTVKCASLKYPAEQKGLIWRAQSSVCVSFSFNMKPIIFYDLKLEGLGDRYWSPNPNKTRFALNIKVNVSWLLHSLHRANIYDMITSRACHTKQCTWIFSRFTLRFPRSRKYYHLLSEKNADLSLFLTHTRALHTAKATESLQSQ